MVVIVVILAMTATVQWQDHLRSTYYVLGIYEPKVIKSLVEQQGCHSSCSHYKRTLRLREVKSFAELVCGRVGT